MRLWDKQAWASSKHIFSIRLSPGPGLDDTMCRLKDNYISVIPCGVFFFLVLFCKHKQVIYMLIYILYKKTILNPIYTAINI